jgi:hypothetical protein
MTKVKGSKRPNCWLRFTAGLLKASTPQFLKEAKALLEELAAATYDSTVLLRG